MGSEIIIVPVLFIGLPWIILHYLTRWKTAAALTGDDENLMESLYELARRLEDRVNTVERIVSAENPSWQALAADATAPGLEDRANTDTLRRVK